MLTKHSLIDAQIRQAEYAFDDMEASGICYMLVPKSESINAMLILTHAGAYLTNRSQYSIRKNQPRRPLVPPVRTP